MYKPPKTSKNPTYWFLNKVHALVDLMILAIRKASNAGAFFVLPSQLNGAEPLGGPWGIVGWKKP